MLIASVTQSMQKSSKETNLAQKHQWFFICLSSESNELDG